MDYAKGMLIFMAAHGMLVGVLLMLGIYLLTSVRSAFTTDVVPNQLVRRTAGHNLLLWVGSYSMFFFYPLVANHPSLLSFAKDMDIMLGLLLVPGIAVLLMSLLQMRRLRSHFLASVVIPMILFVCHCFRNDHLFLKLTVAYWMLAALVFVCWFVWQERKYHRHLHDLYSDLEHHEIRWVYRIMWVFFGYLVLFMFSHVWFNKPVLYYLLYIYCIGLWLLVTYYVDRYECVAHFWKGVNDALQTEEEPEVRSEVIGERDEELGEKRGAKERDLSWIGERLKAKCEGERLYLRHDLNVDVLASYIATNRTYIGQYLSSQGLTYYSYINRLRVAYAKQLIRESKAETLSSIAMQSGFKSDSTFRRAFMEVENCTPSEFEKMVRGGD